MNEAPAPGSAPDNGCDAKRVEGTGRRKRVEAALRRNQERRERNRSESELLEDLRQRTPRVWAIPSLLVANAAVFVAILHQFARRRRLVGRARWVR